MTDHWQAAIDAAAEEFGFSRPEVLGEVWEAAERALAAAEPHLRRAWAEELFGDEAIDRVALRLWRQTYAPSADFSDRSRRIYRERARRLVEAALDVQEPEA